MITHHPETEMLLDYADGSLREADSLVVASHLSMCAECRRRVEEFEAVGGVLLADVAPVSVDESVLDAVMARLDEHDQAPIVREPQLDERTLSVIPPPLRPYIGGSLSELNWRRIGRGISEARFRLGGDGIRASLLHIDAGRAVPSHTHGGNELTLVLAGGFSDAEGHYGRGDLAVADSDVKHTPVADEGEPCLCLAVLDGPTKLTGPIGRFVNVFNRD